MSDAPLRLDDGKIVVGEMIRVTLQRAFPEDWQDEDDRPPRSYGRLPLVRCRDASDDQFAVALVAEEHVWIGFEAVDAPHAARIDVSFAPDRLGRLSMTCPPDYALKGIPTESGWRPFGPDDRLRLDVRPGYGTGPAARQREASILLRFLPARRVLNPGEMAALRPLSRSDGYGGALLP